MSNTDTHSSTSIQLRHVFACQGKQMHLNTGTRLLQKGSIDKCPDCGAPVYDATNTPVGMAFFAHARPDLGDLPS